MAVHLETKLQVHQAGSTPVLSVRLREKSRSVFTLPEPLLGATSYKCMLLYCCTAVTAAWSTYCLLKRRPPHTLTRKHYR